MTQKTQVNPWTWQDPRGFSQGWRVDGASSIVFVAGHGPLDDDGGMVGAGDFDAQTRQVFRNLQTTLEAAGATFADVVKVTVYLTDITMLGRYGRIKREFMGDVHPTSTGLGVAGLGLPGMMIEIDAIAVL